eukprot:TRINITY_DN617_c0_g1_i7.p1 TRINITY_DN617_c0_g1~~TRINITY_DN617_c0_g1_i7.p1  ORF type:complete len:111 (-),score=5.75 TRINITY_DN617_c0_g1_i7:323-655(-)
MVRDFVKITGIDWLHRMQLSIAVYDGTRPLFSITTGRRVAALRSFTIMRNPSLVEGQYPPKDPPLSDEMASITKYFLYSMREGFVYLYHNSWASNFAWYEFNLRERAYAS